VSLQSVAQGTLKDSKSGSGWDALRLYREGRMDDLKRYCLDDVRITRRVYDYGLEHGKVYFLSNRDYQTHEIPVDWKGSLAQKETAKNAFPTSLF